MRNVDRCDRCNKFIMVGIDNGSALLFAHQWCKCSEERENVMSDNTRDTQFKNFANALYMECQNIYQEALVYGSIDADQRVVRHIARRAYDFAYHMALHFDEKDFDVLGFDEALARIPDMTELPKEQG